MHKVSVLIPAYNYGRFVGEAIQSVLDQTFNDFELIVVDDGSTDNTKEVVDSFTDPRIKYIYQENRGQIAAGNTSILASSGEYVALLDADDIMLKEALEKSIMVLDSNREVAFSYGQAYLIDENGQILGLKERHHKYPCIQEGKEVIRELLIHGNYIIPSTAIVRRSCLDKIGLLDPALHCGGADYDLWIRLAKRYAVACLAEPLAKYRVHSESLSNARKVDEIRQTNYNIFESVFNDIEIGPLFSTQRFVYYSHLYVRLADYANEKRERKTARGYLYRALRVDPKHFFRRLWLPWTLRFTKTLIPLSILSLARKLKRFVFSNIILRWSIRRIL
jgi:glycosyltransferase involved in cell wall biosynthesis